MKRILAALLSVLMLMSALAFTAVADNVILIAPNPAANKQSDILVTELRTSNDPEEYFELHVEDDTLKLSGVVNNTDIKYLCVPFAGENVVIQLLHGSRFTAKFDLTKIKGSELEFSVYTGKDLRSEFISVFYGRDIVLKKQDESWGIVINRNTYESNVKAMAGWIDEKSNIESDIPEKIVRAANTITQDLEGDYAKARAIHEYVADLLYYDYEYANLRTNKTNVTASDVFDNEIAVCEGYANLTIALLNAVDIPAVFIEGYALGINSSATDWDNAKISKANHAWVEAYVDGAWIVMDPTWDSKNSYEGGEKTKLKTDFYRFFDMTPEMLASTHLVLSRPNVFGQKGISDWALPESQEAYRYGLITGDCLVAMPDAITRLEFCDLVINMLSVKLGKSIDKILADKNVKINPKAFVDTDYYNILAANALGIVNGKEEGKFDPNGTIKRQEAAAMLQRSAVNVLGVKKPNSSAVEFTDAETFADWGRDAINFVSASMDKNGRKVMGGKEEGKFAPNDLYTKEQSVLTILRLYTAY